MIVKVKQTSKVPREFKPVMERLATVLGFGSDSVSNYALDSIQLLQLDMYNAETNQILVTSTANRVLDQFWSANDPRRP